MIKRTKELKLLFDKENRKNQGHRFLPVPDLSIDNNLAERDLKMARLQQITSSCFRTPEAGLFFAKNSSYISTKIKKTFPFYPVLVEHRTTEHFYLTLPEELEIFISLQEARCI